MNLSSKLKLTLIRWLNNKKNKNAKIKIKKILANQEIDKIYTIKDSIGTNGNLIQ